MVNDNPIYCENVRIFLIIYIYIMFIFTSFYFTLLYCIARLACVTALSIQHTKCVELTLPSVLVETCSQHV